MESDTNINCTRFLFKNINTYVNTFILLVFCVLVVCLYFFSTLIFNTNVSDTIYIGVRLHCPVRFSVHGCMDNNGHGYGVLPKSRTSVQLGLLLGQSGDSSDGGGGAAIGFPIVWMNVCFIEESEGQSIKLFMRHIPTQLKGSCVMHQFSQSNELPHLSIKPIAPSPLGQGEGLYYAVS